MTHRWKRCPFHLQLWYDFMEFRIKQLKLNNWKAFCFVDRFKLSTLSLEFSIWPSEFAINENVKISINGISFTSSFALIMKNMNVLIFAKQFISTIIKITEIEFTFHRVGFFSSFWQNFCVLLLLIWQKSPDSITSRETSLLANSKQRCWKE